MSREHKIPGRFLVAERAAVEESLRSGIRAALRSHKQSHDFLASWEDGRVVLVPAVSFHSLEPCSNREAFEDSKVFMEAHDRTTLLFNVKNVYVKDDTFYVEYVNKKHDPFFYRRPDGFARELREICYELTARALDIRVVEEDESGGKNLLLELPKPPARAEATPKQEVAPPRVAEILPRAPRPQTPLRGQPEVKAGDTTPQRDS